MEHRLFDDSEIVHPTPQWKACGISSLRHLTLLPQPDPG
jgi:hypothetical protein